MNLQEIVTKRTGKAISQCSNEELYFSLLEMTKGMAEEKVSNEGTIFGKWWTWTPCSMFP